MTEMIDYFDARLAQLLCTRVCHDLAGPVGAVVNGAELLAGDPDFALEASALLGDSASAASARIKFFRAAFGWTGSNAPDVQAALDLLNGYYRAAAGSGGAPITHWTIEDGVILDKEAVQMALNLGMLIFDCLPQGGTADFYFSTSGAKFKVVASGASAALREGMEAALRLEKGGLSPKTAQAYLAASLADRLGCRIEVDAGADRVVLSVCEF